MTFKITAKEKAMIMKRRSVTGGRTSEDFFENLAKKITVSENAAEVLYERLGDGSISSSGIQRTCAAIIVGLLSEANEMCYRARSLDNLTKAEELKIRKFYKQFGEGI